MSPYRRPRPTLTLSPWAFPPEWPNGRRLAIFGCVFIIVALGFAFYRGLR